MTPEQADGALEPIEVDRSSDAAGTRHASRRSRRVQAGVAAVLILIAVVIASVLIVRSTSGSQTSNATAMPESSAEMARLFDQAAVGKSSKSAVFESWPD